MISDGRYNPASSHRIHFRASNSATNYFIYSMRKGFNCHAFGGNMCVYSSALLERLPVV